MFALGIDPGLTRCGYGAVRQLSAGGRRSSDLRLEAVGHLTTPRELPVAQRLGILLEDLRQLLADVRPDVVVVERVLFQTNARTAMSVGQASGLALATAAQAGCPVVQYSPNEVKQAVAGHGAATKMQVQRMVQVLLQLDQPPRPADRADALALAICHLTGARLRQAASNAEMTPHVAQVGTSR
ncbi:MAG: crossover junction endodeoxyribonuclease RuvC [Acidimicrobiales bacterium]